ncbi:MAG TPA: bifunctional methylenetetrahydrofolate dehydrogenase/methenyltetrahydrofolate cyclohydrolase FolD [Feifaniaceae bacterium]|nr:bifunctional methylenetetrahydrofolate dehydrogenase/methenyltetrahydrofolate cyclohydrolase FolD [Feifaniaceae bacterium]
MAKARLIDGKAVAAAARKALLGRIERLKQAGVTPGLCVILVGNDPASESYVASKERMAASLGMHGAVIRLPEETTQEELLERIGALNADALIHGILVQLPLPGQIDPSAVASAISPEKDVDGLHPVNAGRLLQREPCMVPCTPNGVIDLIKSTGTEIKGRHAVVVGRSDIVGKPAAILLMHHDATVTVCHSRTKDLADFTRQADILVCAIGRPGLITGDMIKPGAVVIDVGTSRVNGKLCGDVAFDGAAEVAGYLTPVPGGVGPMTIAMLMRNTVEAAERLAGL